MSIQLIVDNVTVPLKFIKFSDGGSNVKLEVPEYLVKHPPKAYYSITVHATTPVDDVFWQVLLVQNAVVCTFGQEWDVTILNLPYLPHARADRVFEQGNPIPLQVFANTVFPCFNRVLLTDPHNPDVVRDWGVVEIKPQHQCFTETVREIQSGDVLIAPDKGALKKIYKLQQHLDSRAIATFVVEASKNRDIKTGRVVSTELNSPIDLQGKRCIIVDDLSDGAGTFIPLAEKLKECGAGSVALYVTHGIFSKGLNILRGKIDKLYVYQTVGTYVTSGDVLNFNNGLEVK